MSNRRQKIKHEFLKLRCKAFFSLLLFLLFTNAVGAQKLPDKIRGYKVYKQKSVVIEQTGKPDANEDLGVRIDLENPELMDVSVSGVRFEVGGKVTIFGQSGTVDFITFRDFEVNGIKVEVEEYTDSFDFTKNSPLILKKPFAMNISASQTLRAAWKEIKNSKDEWLVTGKIFVFGKFRKFGFNFKRVVPVEIRIKIPNPIKSEENQNSRQSN